MKQNEIIEFSVTSLGKYGEGTAEHEGKTIFIEGALPDERVIARIGAIKPNYAVAKLVSLKQENPYRVIPNCTKFSTCGGCQLMHLSYDEQLKIKTQFVKDAFIDHEDYENIDFFSCLASPNEFFYRNKIQLPIQRKDEKLIAGFYKRGSHDIIMYDKCLVHHESMESAASTIRAILDSSLIETYCEQSMRGTLRHFIMRANQKGELLVGLVTTGRQREIVRQVAKTIREQIKNVVGVIENINGDAQNKILGATSIILEGNPYIQEEILSLSFRISLESFFQVNLSTAKILYEKALEFAEFDKNAIVLDAYCGIGTLTLLAALHYKKVIGIECVTRAVEDAKENALRNNIKNADFLVAKIEEQSELFKDINGAFLNPPRQGLNIKVVEALNAYGPERIVYISCNPHTLARDAMLLESYTLKKVQPIDMFPHTVHVESVALFERKIG